MITINIFLLLKVLGISYVIVNFQPITWMIDKLKPGMLQWTLHNVTGCLKCCSWWLSLIWTWNIWFSCFVFLMVSVLTRDEKFQYYNNLIKSEIYNKIHEWRLRYYIKKTEKCLEKINKMNEQV